MSFHSIQATKRVRHGSLVVSRNLGLLHESQIALVDSLWFFQKATKESKKKNALQSFHPFLSPLPPKKKDKKPTDFRPLPFNKNKKHETQLTSRFLTSQPHLLQSFQQLWQCRFLPWHQRKMPGATEPVGCSNKGLLRVGFLSSEKIRAAKKIAKPLQKSTFKKKKDVRRRVFAFCILLLVFPRSSDMFDFRKGKSWWGIHREIYENTGFRRWQAWVSDPKQ